MNLLPERRRRNIRKAALSHVLTGLLVMQVAASVARAQTPVPIEKEPRHRLKFENQFVRVFDVLIPPGDRSLFHIHVHDGVSVRITNASIRDEPLAGTSQDLTLPRGAVTFAYRPSPLTHRVSNIGSTPFRNVFIEILGSPGLPTSAPSRAAESDIVLENDRLRVRRLVLAPGQSTDRRAPAPGGVRVALSEGKILLKTAGKDETVKVEPGDFQWHEEGMASSLKNAGSKAFEAVDIELN